MATYRVIRPLTYKPRPMTHRDRASVRQCLDDWYGLFKSMPPGGFTDLCEVFTATPREMRGTIEAWRRQKRRAKRCSTNYGE